MAKNKKKKDSEKNDDTKVNVDIKNSDNSEDAPIDKNGNNGNGESKERNYDQELNDAEDKYLRLAAEFENYKKRTARQFDEIGANAKATIYNQIFDVVDNFERALDAAKKSTEFDSLLKGTELIYQQCLEIIKRGNLEPIKAVGEEFDPNFHEAVMQIESNEYDEGIIVQEMLKGYKTDKKVIRFSKVLVSKGAPVTDADDKKDDQSDDE